MKKYSKYTVISMQYAVSSKLCRLLKTLLPAYCLLLCCLLLTEMVTAQIYPVQATPQMVPPYSFKLSDYATTTQEKLFVNLLLTDAQESGRQVRLKLFVEGPGGPGPAAETTQAMLVANTCTIVNALGGTCDEETAPI